TIPSTDSARFRPAASKKDVDGPSTSRAAYDSPSPSNASGQISPEASTPSIDVRKHIDELERMVHCAICMDRPKDTAFACGHTYCNECAVELRQCTFGCKKQNGKPLTFKYRVFL
ncbi:zinc finger protein, partial [Aphelenchoides avenae]